jgi:hypothetical protein
LHPTASDAPGSKPATPTATANIGGQAPASKGGEAFCPAGYGTGVIPKWKQGLQIVEAGDSIGCKLYQEATVDARRTADKRNLKGIPFKRWLYWRTPGANWLPETPEASPVSLGTFGNWELGTTSKACFNDFVLLVQSASPDAASAGAQGARLMLNNQ